MHQSAHMLGLPLPSELIMQMQIDAHYCAATWRYMQELAVTHRDMTTLVSMDDKHKVNVGEPGYPLAAAEIGKQWGIMISANAL